LPCAAANAEWNSAEIERFQQAVVEYDKDFMKISQHVTVINITLNKPHFSCTTAFVNNSMVSRFTIERLVVFIITLIVLYSFTIFRSYNLFCDLSVV